MPRKVGMFVLDTDASNVAVGEYFLRCEMGV